MSGCTGDCCAAFTLTKAEQLRILNGMDEEYTLVRDMLIPLGEGEFTCKWWHTLEKKCGIYEHRPTMCRGFPAKGSPCGVEGCTEENHGTD